MGELQAIQLHTGMLQRWSNASPWNVQVVDVSTDTQCNHTTTLQHVYTRGHLQQKRTII